MIMVHRLILRIAFVVCLIILHLPVYSTSSLAKNDPYPVFSSLDPHTFLYMHEKLKIKDPDFAQRKRDNVGISLSPFGQNADRGRDFDGVRVPLGDVMGRWSMIPLLYGPIPDGKILPPSLQTALTNLFPGVAPGDLNDATKIDPNQDFGFFSVPLKYRKRGVRTELAADIYAGFGISVQTGIVSITQTSTGFIDLTPCPPLQTCPFDPAPLTTESVQDFLMEPLKTIAKDICLNICDFCETSVEEVRINLFWRRGFEINRDDEDWPHFLIIPFFQITGSVSPGDENRLDEQSFNRSFFVPFGNNDHSAVAFTTGLDIDFVESMEVGAEVGITYFFERNFEKFRLPTNEFQQGIFPFATDVSVHPGYNWHFGAKIATYHFLDRLSGWFQYIQMEHKQDDITLRRCEDADAFMPEQLEKISGFKAKMINAALNYDISPNIALGVFWQAPVSQRNSYRSSTIMFSFNATF